VTAASRNWVGFVLNWALIALVGLPILFMLFMLPLGLGFSSIWHDPSLSGSIRRSLAITATIAPYPFLLAMVAAWPLHWLFNNGWVLKFLWLLLLIELLLLISVMLF